MDRRASPRRWAIVSGVAALLFTAAWLVFGVLPPRIEGAVARRLGSAAARWGLALTVRRVEFSWLSPLVLRDVSIERPGSVTARAARVDVEWRLLPRGGPRPTRVSYAGASLSLPGGVEAALADASWRVLRLQRGELNLRREGGEDALAAAWGGESGFTLGFASLDLTRLVKLSRQGRPLAESGRWDGRLEAAPAEGGALDVDLLAFAHRIRLASLTSVEAGENGSAPQAAELGPPTDLELALDGRVDIERRLVSFPCWRLRTSGVEGRGGLWAESYEGDLFLDLTLDVPKVDLAHVLAALSLDLPAGAAPLEGDLGSVSLTARATGRLLDPASVTVQQRLSLTPPPDGIPALEYLNGPFLHRALQDGVERRIEVDPFSPDFVPLEDIPPLFVRALLLSEDAAFYAHKGIDLAEIGAALATNAARGAAARGGSTITQQLAKNLFLTREKRVSRKVQEAALTLLLESVLSKRRILEIYLNVIEWGPGVFGLRQASCHYFGKEPRDLTPKEIAFLVALVPGPIKYQRSFADGRLSPGFSPLVTNILAKLRSVDALTEEAYEAAREERLFFLRAEPTPR